MCVYIYIIYIYICLLSSPSHPLKVLCIRSTSLYFGRTRAAFDTLRDYEHEKNPSGSLYYLGPKRFSCKKTKTRIPLPYNPGNLRNTCPTFEAFSAASICSANECHSFHVIRMLTRFSWNTPKDLELETTRVREFSPTYHPPLSILFQSAPPPPSSLENVFRRKYADPCEREILNSPTTWKYPRGTTTRSVKVNRISESSNTMASQPRAAVESRSYVSCITVASRDQQTAERKTARRSWWRGWTGWSLRALQIHKSANRPFVEETERLHERLTHRAWYFSPTRRRE